VLISVITPTLNGAAYLCDCLDSVGSLPGADVEHIVVDGGSTDRTIEIVRSSTSAILLERPGSNQARAINVGLRASRGEVVAWLNADDRYQPGALRFVADRFAADPTLDVLYGDCDVIDAQDRPLWREKPGTYDFKRLLRRGNYIAQPAVFLRRRVLDQVGYLDESFECGMDLEMWLRLKGCHVDYFPEVLADFRWHPDSKTSRNQLLCWQELLRALRRHGGGWTPALAWAYWRMLLAVARGVLAGALVQVRTRLTGKGRTQ
jgi:glycosyltransferase involved in cell wall biosynthesis